MLRLKVNFQLFRFRYFGPYTFSIYSLFVVGVIYSDSIGKSHEAWIRPKGEVILSAGAISSPQLLLLSGVGPQQYLSSLNISIIHPQPFVGQFMNDVPRNDINFVPPFPSEGFALQLVWITRNGYSELISSNIPFLSVLTLMGKLSRTLSISSLKLASRTNMRINPVVRFNYFANLVDLANCVKVMRNVGMMLKTRSMEQYKFQDWNGTKYFKFVGQSLPEDLSNDASIKTLCQKTLVTIWHYHGGCLVGESS
ncbi:hypothetical protein F0562_030485 [Nyssa sinensis]|uniref:(R)-mandelonitrile lyase n=1 Tax=Nyssa sinensis TaxID=561372 RepID=A0A5J5B0P6_9ASTE|nr:hypothetical protein F0562_030485 [Nyssa sinensis]